MTWVAHDNPLEETKKVIIESIIERCRSLTPVPSSVGIHLSFCEQYHTVFRDVVYRSLIKASLSPPESTVEWEIVSFQQPKLLSVRDVQFPRYPSDFILIQCQNR